MRGPSRGAPTARLRRQHTLSTPRTLPVNEVITDISSLLEAPARRRCGSNSISNSQAARPGDPPISTSAVTSPLTPGTACLMRAVLTLRSGT